MSFNIVTVNETLVVDSRLIAEGLGIEHSNTFIRTIQKYKAEFEELGVLVMGSQKPNYNYDNYSKGGRPEQFYYLNEDQATYAVTLSQNTDKVRECKRNLVKAFSAAKKQLNQGFYGDPLQAIAQQIQELKEENQLLRAKTRLLESKSQPDFSKLQELTQHLAQSNPEMLAMMVEKFAIACYEMGRKKNKKLPETVLLPENTIDTNDLESLMPILEYIKQNNGQITTREICRKFNRKFIVDGEAKNMNSKVAYRIMEILAIAGYGEINQYNRNSIKFEIFATLA